MMQVRLWLLLALSCNPIFTDNYEIPKGCLFGGSLFLVKITVVK